MANKYYSANHEKPKPLPPPKPATKGQTAKAPTFPTISEEPQKGL